MIPVFIFNFMNHDSWGADNEGEFIGGFFNICLVCKKIIVSIIQGYRWLHIIQVVCRNPLCPVMFFICVSAAPVKAMEPALKLMLGMSYSLEWCVTRLYKLQHMQESLAWCACRAVVHEGIHQSDVELEIVNTARSQELEVWRTWSLSKPAMMKISSLHNWTVVGSLQNKVARQSIIVLLGSSSPSPKNLSKNYGEK